MANDAIDTILWIYCDELRADVLSCYGGPRGLTPRLDGLAARGEQFTRAYCSSPVCVPSRCSALTGLPPTRTGVYHNEAAWPGFVGPERPRTFVEELEDAGWRVVSAGKVHLPQGMRPFVEHDPASSGMDDITGRFSREELRIITPPGVSTSIGGRWPDEVPFPPECVTEKACASLKDGDPRKRLIRASYLQPHTPVTPPDRYIKRLEAMGLDLSVFDQSAVPSRFERCASENIRGRDMRPEDVRACRIAYLALVAWLDDQVGVLLRAVEESGRAASTAVIFTADHGASLGEAGLWAKQLFCPASHRVPLLMAAPHLEPAVRDDLADSTDVAPTIAGLAGMPAPEHWTGRDLIREQPPEAVFAIIGQGEAESRQFPNKAYGAWEDGGGWPRRACVRTKDWRYERNVRRNGQALDPDHPDADVTLIRCGEHEEHNIARNPDHATIVAWLEVLLAEELAHAVEPDVLPTRT